MIMTPKQQELVARERTRLREDARMPVPKDLPLRMFSVAFRQVSSRSFHGIFTVLDISVIRMKIFDRLDTLVRHSLVLVFKPQNLKIGQVLIVWIHAAVSVSCGRSEIGKIKFPSLNRDSVSAIFVLFPKDKIIYVYISMYIYI